MPSQAELAAKEIRSNSPAGVLAVDDDPAVLCLLAAWLRREGFEVWPACQGGQAVELYQRHRHAIVAVLIDVRMPGMDGPQTLAALRQLDASVPCCFLTGDPAPYTEEGLLQLGAVRVFRKPFAFPEILATLNDLAAQAPRRRPDRAIAIPQQRSGNHVGAHSQAG
jgi:CheY-like chemotaxis protein